MGAIYALDTSYHFPKTRDRRTYGREDYRFYGIAENNTAAVNDDRVQGYASWYNTNSNKGLGRVLLPAGHLQVETPIPVGQGVKLHGAGQAPASLGGTEITNAFGDGIHLFSPQAGEYNHWSLVQGLGVVDCGGHGFLIEGTGETLTLFQTKSNDNQGDGYAFRPSGSAGGVPHNGLGIPNATEAHGNKGYGYSIWKADTSNINMKGMSADNNTKGAIHLKDFSPETVLKLDSWKAERHLLSNAPDRLGHGNQVVLIENCPGSMLDLGYLHCIIYTDARLANNPPDVTVESAIIRVTGTNPRLRFLVAVKNFNGNNSAQYDYGYVSGGTQKSVADINRKYYNRWDDVAAPL